VRQIAAEAIGLLRPRRREEWRGKAAVFAAGARWCLEHLRGSRS
jgi:hypothetical protein